MGPPEWQARTTTLVSASCIDPLLDPLLASTTDEVVEFHIPHAFPLASGNGIEDSAVVLPRDLVRGRLAGWARARWGPSWQRIAMLTARWRYASVATSTALMVCIRFSAWSNTMLAGDSNTSLLTSTPSARLKSRAICSPTAVS